MTISAQELISNSTWIVDMIYPCQSQKVNAQFQHHYLNDSAFGNSSKILNRKMGLRVIDHRYMLCRRIFFMVIVVKQRFRNFIRRVRLDSNYTKMKTIKPKLIFKDNCYKIISFAILNSIIYNKIKKVRTWSRLMALTNLKNSQISVF